ncbi:MAG: hypothetical protein K2L00_03580 [Muribaculaceae bacterium]|nr:hypothetical protein [Muribaculaceae bacterium]
MAYLNDPILGARLYEICLALMRHKEKDPAILSAFTRRK